MDIESVLKQIASLRSGLDSLEAAVLSGAPKFPAQKNAAIEQEICLGCGEHRTAKSGRFLRGNHESCYRLVIREIEAGRITEREAIEQGFLRPQEVSGRPKARASVREYLDKKTNAVVADIHAQAEKLVAERDAKRKKKP